MLTTSLKLHFIFGELPIGTWPAGVARNQAVYLKDDGFRTLTNRRKPLLNPHERCHIVEMFDIIACRPLGSQSHLVAKSGKCNFATVLSEGVEQSATKYNLTVSDAAFYILDIGVIKM